MAGEMDFKLASGTLALPRKTTEQEENRVQEHAIDLILSASVVIKRLDRLPVFEILRKCLNAFAQGHRNAS
jgi:hypothetical protein